MAFRTISVIVLQFMCWRRNWKTEPTCVGVIVVILPHNDIILQYLFVILTFLSAGLFNISTIMCTHWLLANIRRQYLTHIQSTLTSIYLFIINFPRMCCIMYIVYIKQFTIPVWRLACELIHTLFYIYSAFVRHHHPGQL